MQLVRSVLIMCSVGTSIGAGAQVVRLDARDPEVRDYNLAADLLEQLDDAISMFESAIAEYPDPYPETQYRLWKDSVKDAGYPTDSDIIVDYFHQLRDAGMDGRAALGLGMVLGYVDETQRFHIRSGLVDFLATQNLSDDNECLLEAYSEFRVETFRPHENGRLRVEIQDFNISNGSGTVEIESNSTAFKGRHTVSSSKLEVDDFEFCVGKILTLKCDFSVRIDDPEFEPSCQISDNTCTDGACIENIDLVYEFSPNLLDAVYNTSVELAGRGLGFRDILISTDRASGSARILYQGEDEKYVECKFEQESSLESGGNALTNIVHKSSCAVPLSVGDFDLRDRLYIDANSASQMLWEMSIFDFGKDSLATGTLPAMLVVDDIIYPGTDYGIEGAMNKRAQDALCTGNIVISRDKRLYTDFGTYDLAAYCAGSPTLGGRDGPF